MFYFKNIFSKSKFPLFFLFSAYTMSKLINVGVIPYKKIKCEVLEEIDDDYFIADIKKFMKKYYLSPDSKKHSFVLFTGNGNKELGQEVAKDLKATLGKVCILKMENGESMIKINENINNKNVIIIQSLSPPINENLMELLFMISAMKRESAKKIIVVCPYFAYSRETVPKMGKITPLPASVIMRLFEELGADQVVAIELHSKPITGFSNTMPIIDLDMVYVGASYFLEKIEKGEIASNPVIVSPDVNGAVRARKFKDILEVSGVATTFGFFVEYGSTDSSLYFYYI
jgi:hypothetical protein